MTLDDLMPQKPFEQSDLTIADFDPDELHVMMGHIRGNIFKLAFDLGDGDEKWMASKGLYDDNLMVNYDKIVKVVTKEVIARLLTDL